MDRTSTGTWVTAGDTVPGGAAKANRTQTYRGGRIAQPGIPASLARTAGFAVVYAAAILAGRMTVISGSRLALMWPAAGVAMIWFCAQRRSRVRWADYVALTVIAFVGNSFTGTGPVLGVFLAMANLVQVSVFMMLFTWRKPTLWGAGGSARLSSPRDLGCVLGMIVVAVVCSGMICHAALWLFLGQAPGLSVMAWPARELASAVVLGTAGLWFGPAVSAFRERHGSVAGWWRSADRALRAMSAWRVAEYLAVALCSVVAYLIGFVYDDGLPLAFPLMAFTVWAAVRLRTGFVVLHTLALGGAAVVFTMHGEGPMAEVADPQMRALLAQFFVVLVAVVGLALALGRDERASLVKELAAQKELETRHAALMGAVIDSMADGLSVIDAQGRVELRNPAGVRLFGDGTETAEAVHRVRQLDGTALTSDSLPSARALAGEKVEPVDVLVTDPEGNDPRIFRVSATPLQDACGARRAVVLFHDVSAERRHREQLAGFAGVVAHDLLSPLTAVEGWTDVAAEALDAAPEHAALDRSRDSLTRVTRAATRMRGLINDLLAYTTARDAELAQDLVDLGTMVADIAAVRTDAAVAAGRPAPQVTVGRLDPVHADVGAVRQLLDNLIGNAVKYTARGVVPQVHVTSASVDGMVQVTVADNGIGIPAGQHAAIFDDFHRAHEGAGYAGTGLGLAICQRIVARQGGTIRAEDNPGGGSRFTFTLPEVDPPAPGGHAELAALTATLPTTSAPTRGVFTAAAVV
ncbi:ATP-binding protein [Krasilnikovia sp. MM14-A1259]|uniref:ATP-binding protein n=1 Tax=Krasilnikovia sp. MM14-A1259 TaxID=3373539 RepID=UPI00399C6DCF